MVDLSGKRALITGSTSGIGLGIARVLHAKGAHIILNGFGDEAEIAKIQNELSADYINTDLSNEDGVIELMNQVGGVDILVNNAGIQHTSPIEDFPSDKWNLIMNLMLSAPFFTTKAALPSMKSKGWGRIINIASVHGLVASPFKSAYVSAKHGVIGLTKVTALENAEAGVTCNAICPGWVLTPLVQKQIDAIAEKEGISNDEARVILLSEKEPTLDFTTPEDIGEMVAFLCSDAARNITGSAYTMDGAWSAR
jgi:3-hydroxybutyrate dehydrogenase